jgi:hypothetical protein
VIQHSREKHWYASAGFGRQKIKVEEDAIFGLIKEDTFSLFFCLTNPAQESLKTYGDICLLVFKSDPQLILPESALSQYFTLGIY